MNRRQLRDVTIFPKPKVSYLSLGATGGFGGSGGFFYANNPAGNSLASKPMIGAPGKILPAWDIQIRQWRVPHTCAGSILVNPLLRTPANLDPWDTIPER